MIVPSDADYIRTKKIRKKGMKLPSPFYELAEWITEQYNVKVLNIEYDKVIPDNRPRLRIIVDTEKETFKFKNGKSGNFIQKDQEKIFKEFDKIVHDNNYTQFMTERMFVIFTAFERVARVEANEKIKKKEINRLQKSLKNSDLWKISNAFDGVTFFFFTEDQVKKYEKQGLRQQYAEKYFSLLKAYDEFDYFTLDNLPVYFDSKENFDKNYQSNWFYYYK